MIEDVKIAIGTTVATVSAGATWVAQATAVGQLLLTSIALIVAGLTAWYTWERANKLRKERKENE